MDFISVCIKIDQKVNAIWGKGTLNISSLVLAIDL